MKAFNKVALINICIAHRVLRNKYEKGMEEDLRKIDAMFEDNNFSELDEIYFKYFVPDYQARIQGNKKR